MLIFNRLALQVGSRLVMSKLGVQRQEVQIDFFQGTLLELI